MAAFAVALATAAPTYGAPAYRPCTGGVHPDGTRAKTGGFYRDIAVRRIGCEPGRVVVGAFAFERPLTPRPRKRVTFEESGTRWTCRSKLAPARDTDEGWMPPYERITCKARGGRRVKFVGAA
jgi:hypothetical protein